jgi:predicted DNA-binding transcriptional regulator YafY
MVAWLNSRGGSEPIADVARRFGMTRAEVVADVELAAMIGMPPYLEVFVDVFIDDERVHVGVPRVFTRPLRLTRREGAALLAAGHAALALPGADPDGPLARALARLAEVVDSPEVAVETPRPPVLDTVREAVAARQRLTIRHFSQRRAVVVERTVVPFGAQLADGRWYLVADDETSGERRRFRLDRVESAVVAGPAVWPPDAPDAAALAAMAEASPLDDSDLPEVTVFLPAEARWVVETYPTRSVEPVAGGLVARLPVTAPGWLERLLLVVGPEARVLEPEASRGLGAAAARRLLARYGVS